MLVEAALEQASDVAADPTAQHVTVRRSGRSPHSSCRRAIRLEFLGALLRQPPRRKVRRSSESTSRWIEPSASRLFAPARLIAPLETIRSSEASDMVGAFRLARELRQQVEAGRCAVLNSLRQLCVQRTSRSGSRRKAAAARCAIPDAPRQEFVRRLGRPQRPARVRPSGIAALRLTVASMARVSPRLDRRLIRCWLRRRHTASARSMESEVRRTEETDRARDVVGLAEAAERDRLRPVSSRARSPATSRFRTSRCPRSGRRPRP